MMAAAFCCYAFPREKPFRAVWMMAGTLVKNSLAKGNLARKWRKRMVK